MIIKVTEAQYRSIEDNLLWEGIEWSKNDNGTLNFTINHKMDNNSNRGKFSADTRVFGTKDDILNGKLLTKTGKINNASKSLTQVYNDRNKAIEFYQDVINYVKNGRQGEFPPNNGIDTRAYDGVVKRLNDPNQTDQDILDFCVNCLSKSKMDASRVSSTYERVSNEKNEDKVARYLTGIVTGTNVKFISLFSMSDFNFSDAIKHGKARQNGNTDALLGIKNAKERPTDEYGNYKEIPVTYDGKYTPNIAQNFSLYNVQPGHYKQQFGLNGEGGYNSVTAFLDKSIIYADYALKKEGFRPDIIISAPSSSDYNKYYCTNLSNKLGVPYINNFFVRNVINVRFDDGRDTTALKNDGFTDKEILEFEKDVKGIAYKEIAYFIAEPVRKFIMSNANYFNNIPLEKSSRQKMPISFVIDCVTNHAYKMAAECIQGNDVVSSHLLKNFYNTLSDTKRKRYDFNYLLGEIQKRIGKKFMSGVLQEVLQLVQKYSQQLKETGYKLQFGNKRFKITHLSSRFRPYLKNVYIIADDYVNENGQLFSRFRNAKFLIFDEDINSGATLKLIIETLKEKLPENTDNNLLCLVNAYSSSGF